MGGLEVMRIVCIKIAENLAYGKNMEYLMVPAAVDITLPDGNVLFSNVAFENMTHYKFSFLFKWLMFRSGMK